jgi:hypothetical protein
MADDNEEVLLKSLAAVDRHRTWLLVGTALGVVLLFLAFGAGARAIHADSHDSVHGVLNFIHAVMLILGVWSGLLALAVVIQVTSMTKKILRAIELASRK